MCWGYRAEKRDAIPVLTEPMARKQTLHYTVMCATTGTDKVSWGHTAGDLSLPGG